MRSWASWFKAQPLAKPKLPQSARQLAVVCSMHGLTFPGWESSQSAVNPLRSIVLAHASGCNVPCGR